MSEQAQQSFTELYRQHEVYSQLDMQHWQNGDAPLNFLRVKQGDIETIDPATHTFAFGVALGGRAGFQVDFGEGLKEIDPFSRGVYLNATCSDTFYRQIGTHDLLFLDAPLQQVALGFGMDVEELIHAMRPLHDGPVFDPTIHAQCLHLWLLRSRHGRFASLAIDHGLLSLAARLIDLARPNHGNSCADSTSLSKTEMTRISSFIDNNLHNPIEMSDIAGLRDVSQWRLLRDFKSAFGQTPHQYVLSRRIARAQELLASGNMPLVEIALACGFASQSHMTDVFRQKLGVTPGRYRKEVR